MPLILRGDLRYKIKDYARMKESEKRLHEQLARLEKAEVLFKNHEIEQENRLNTYPLEKHLRAFARSAEDFDESTLEENAKLPEEFLKAHEALVDLFDRTGKIPLGDMASVTHDVKRINQIETVIKHYSAKIMDVKKDDSLDDELRETQLAYWQRLMDTEIAKLEEM